MISPYYNKPTQEGIFRHYEAVAKAARFPIIVYNIPGRTASKIEASTIARLAELDEIVGLKEATGSMDELQDVLRLCGEGFAVYAGDDSMTLPVLAVGGCGAISVIANMMPKEHQSVVVAAQRGDWKAAREQHFRMLPVMRSLFLETNPIPIKAALHAMGICRDEVRLPLVPMSPEPREKLLAVLQSHGLIG
jgi:4-hydroxy-tetrahydrodipicolinate synthase